MVESTGTLGSLPRLELERPTHGEVVRMIMDESHAEGVSCDHDTAQRVYGLMYRALKHIRKGGGDVLYHLDDREIADLHTVLDAVMPDEVVNPVAGSAHDAIHRHFLNGDEFALVHTKDGERLEFCAVALEMRTAA